MNTTTVLLKTSAMSPPFTVAQLPRVPVSGERVWVDGHLFEVLPSGVEFTIVTVGPFSEPGAVLTVVEVEVPRTIPGPVTVPAPKGSA